MARTAVLVAVSTLALTVAPYPAQASSPTVSNRMLRQALEQAWSETSQASREKVCLGYSVKPGLIVNKMAGPLWKQGLVSRAKAKKAVRGFLAVKCD